MNYSAYKYFIAGEVPDLTSDNFCLGLALVGLRREWVLLIYQIIPQCVVSYLIFTSKYTRVLIIYFFSPYFNNVCLCFFIFCTSLK